MKTRLLLLAALLSASAALAQDRLPSASLPTCTDGDPWDVVLVDASTTTDCNNVGGSTVEAWCCCRDGAIAACLTSTSSNSFATMNAPSGTDPAAASSSDTLNFTAAGGLSITGNSGTKTLAFDFASTSFTPAVSAPAVDAANGVWTIANGVMFEGATADTFEMQLFAEDLTADRFIQFPNMTGYVQLSDCATCYGTAANSVMATTNGVLFEGTTANAFETTLLAGDPTADRSITLPDETGTLLSTASNYAASVSPGGPATTATAFVTNPGDCSVADGTEFAWQINATGDFSCVPVQQNYDQYDPDNPPASVGTGGWNEEWTGDTASVSWTWMNQDAATETISKDSSLITGEATAEENRGRYAAAATNADQTLTAKLIGVPFPTLATNSSCFIGEISAGTVASPTALEFVGFGDFATDNIGFYGDTNIDPSAGVTLHGSTYTTWTIIYFYVSPIYLQLRYIDSTRALTAWSSWDGISWFQIGASATIAADPLFWGFGARDTAICRFYWVHLRTGSNLNDAGE